jgi:hypothetical protein
VRTERGPNTTKDRLEEIMPESTFDMDVFMRVCGWHPWPHRQEADKPEETILWWNRECMTFGRVRDRFF